MIQGTIRVPANEASPNPYNVTIVTADGGTGGKDGAILITGFPKPTITAIIPATTWYRNATVRYTITGTNFRPGYTTVNFTYPANGTPLNMTQGAVVQFVNATAINGTLVVPWTAPAGPVNVSVTTVDGGKEWKSTAVTIAGFPKPSVTATTPSSGYRNTTVAFTLTGTNFQPGQTQVYLTNPLTGMINATIYSVTPTQIIGGMRIPGNATTGSWTFKVITLDGGTGSSASAFTISRLPQPVITTFAPSVAYRATQTSFILNGSYFETNGLTAVNLTKSGQPQISVNLTSVSTTQITGNFTVPWGTTTTGPWNINVTTLDGGVTTKTGVVSVL
jgi:hypothetical protein